jgi:hypothetical protein
MDVLDHQGAGISSNRDRKLWSEVAGKILGAAGGLIMALVVLTVAVLVNGGFVYKTSCATADGHTITHWSYAISDVIPYIGYAESGCQSHTGTRELLSAVGVWPLGSKHTANAGSGHTLVSSDDYAVGLRADINAILGTADDEKAAAAKLQADGLAIPKAIDVERRFAVAYAQAIAKAKADAPPNGVDPDLRTLWGDMIELAQLHRESDLVLASDLVANGRLTAHGHDRIRALAARYAPLSRDTSALGRRLAQKYSALQ